MILILSSKFHLLILWLSNPWQYFSLSLTVSEAYLYIVVLLLFKDDACCFLRWFERQCLRLKTCSITYRPVCASEISASSRGFVQGTVGVHICWCLDGAIVVTMAIGGDTRYLVSFGSRGPAFFCHGEGSPWQLCVSSVVVCCFG